MRVSLVVAAVLLAAVAAPAAATPGIGDRLVHTFLKFDTVPLTTADATNAGWKAARSDCQDGMGTAWTPNGDPLTEHYPVIAYYTKGGYLGGIGLLVWGDLPPSLIESGWWNVNDDETHIIQLSFRSSGACDFGSYDEPVGDQLVVNPSSVAFSIPLSHSSAMSRGFVQGACIGGMGVHHSYDIVHHPQMAWNASTFMPVTPMYDQHTGDLNAFLVLTSANQQLQPFFGNWEGPFISHLLCENWCDDKCIDGMGNTDDGGSHLWNTMHFMLGDHKNFKCDSHC